MAKTPTKFDIRDRLGYRVQNLANKMILWSGRTYMEKFGVGVQEWRVLSILMRTGEGTAKMICDLTLMDKGNVSRSVKRLLEAGHLKEQPDEKDKRSSVLFLTPSGLKLYNKIKTVSDDREKSFLAALSQSERKALPNILSNLDGVIEELLQKQEEQK